jgi:hypothetical protein
MIPDTMSENSALLSATVRLPQHVVFRSFPSETVMLNLQTGKYHGLNGTAGRMLEELERTPRVRDAAAVLAENFDQTRDTIERDLCLLCRSLLERGLIEIDAQPPS